jgi:hypothetical protein
MMEVEQFETRLGAKRVIPDIAMRNHHDHFLGKVLLRISPDPKSTQSTSQLLAEASRPICGPSRHGISAMKNLHGVAMRFQSFHHFTDQMFRAASVLG